MAITVRNDIKQNSQLVDDLENNNNQEIICIQINLHRRNKIYDGVYYGKQENTPADEAVYKTSGRPFANATCQLYGRLLNGGSWSVLSTAKEPSTECLTSYVWRYLVQHYWTTMLSQGHTKFL